SAAGDRRPPADDVRPAKHPRAQRVGRLAKTLRRQALQNRDSAQGAARRGAELWHTRAESRQVVLGGAGLSLTCGRNAKAQGSRNGGRSDAWLSRRASDADWTRSFRAATKIRAGNRCRRSHSIGSCLADFNRARGWTKPPWTSSRNPSRRRASCNPYSCGPPTQAATRLSRASEDGERRSARG